MIRSQSVSKILITNIVSLNPGDAAILSGTIDILRKKYGEDVEVTVFDKQAAAAEKYYPWAHFRQSLFPSLYKGVAYRVLEKAGYSHWLERFRFARFYVAVLLLKNHLAVLCRLLLSASEIDGLKEYISADLILSTGGTYLIENYDLAPAIMDYRITMLCGSNYGFFTQTLGPFREESHRRAFKAIFSRATVILLRDEMSRENILGLGVSGNNIHLAADAAFVFAKDGLCASKHEDGRAHAGGPLSVAISVRSMKNFHPEKSEQYLAGIVEAVRVVVEEFDGRVTFLSTCQGIDEYWASDDKTADEVYALLPENIRDSVEVDRKFRQPWGVVKTYSSFDAVIATRMHAAILSLCAGTPTLGFAYEFKMEELFRNIGMDELVISIDFFGLKDVTGRVRELLSKKDEYSEKVVTATEKMCEKAWSAIDVLPNSEK